MQISKGLIIALVGALLFGALEALGESKLQDLASDSRTAVAPTHVPIGHVGDRLVYARFERTLPQDEWVRTPDTDYQVTTLAQQADRSAALHDVVFVSTNQSWTSTGGLLEMESRALASGTHSVAIDLATRDMLGFRDDGNASRQGFFALQNHDEIGRYIYGPEQPNPTLFGPEAYTKFPLVLPQGQTYAAGETRPELVPALLGLEASNLHLGWGAVELQELTAQGVVQGTGLVDGHRAVSLQAQGCVALVISDPDEAFFFDGEPVVEFLGFMTAVPSRVCFTITSWVSADNPYPLLVEVRSAMDGGPTRESLTSLAAYEAGTQPIPWTTNSAVAYRASNPDLERSPATQNHPADGKGSRLSYPLSAALRAVSQDPTLLGYVAWRAQHPDATLIGAHMLPTGPDQQGRRWSLTFGLAAGLAYVVQTDRATAQALPTQTDVGEFSINRFTPAPMAPITFGAVEALWRGVFDAPDNALVPNTATWGFLYHPDSLYCPQTDRCDLWTDDFYAGTRPDLVSLGYTLDQAKNNRVTAIGPERVGDLVLYGNATTGNLEMQAENRRDFHVEPLAVGADYQAIQPRPVPGPPVATINYQHAGIASMSFLAFVLVAYFFPTLKLVGTKALFFVPGFARIQKSELLHNKVRETMVSAIRLDPGVTAPHLQTLTGAGWSTVVYHLGVLEKAKLVSSFVDGRHKRFFPVETIHASDRVRVALLKNARTRGLYEAILGEPGVGFRDLARELGISRPALYWHVDRLTKVGLVGQDRDGNRIRFYANENHSGLSPSDPSAATEVA